MSRGRPDHERRNLPFSASLRNRWWCDLVMRRRRQERKEAGQEEHSDANTQHPKVQAGRKRRKNRGNHHAGKDTPEKLEA